MKGFSAFRHAPYGTVHGYPEPYMVQGAIRNLHSALRGAHHNTKGITAFVERAYCS